MSPEPADLFFVADLAVQATPRERGQVGLPVVRWPPLGGQLPDDGPTAPAQQDRPDSTPPAHLLTGYHVHDNLICVTGDGGHPTGVGADNGANLGERDISFSGNTIQSAPCE